MKVYSGKDQIKHEELNLNSRIEAAKHMVMATGLKTVLGELA